MDASIEAWNSRDIERLMAAGWTRGYGFRTMDPRTSQNLTPDVIRRLLEQFFNSIEHYKIIPGESNIVIDEDIAITWGSHIEEVRHNGKPTERIKVRSSATHRRSKDGQWRTLMSHGDFQQFAENGGYIPRYD
ncbi:MAG: ketosteroid isomerase-like protein [Arenicella sp.]|jgi:ketosteroid isomerase-like protein